MDYDGKLQVLDSGDPAKELIVGLLIQLSGVKRAVGERGIRYERLEVEAACRRCPT